MTDGEFIPESSNGSSGIGAALTKKIGPLPGYIWVVGIVGLYAVYRLWSRRGSGVIPTGIGLDPTHLATDASMLPSPSLPASASPSGIPGSQTNAQWARQAAQELIAQGVDPVEVENALSNYLNGKDLTAAQKAIVSKALQEIGSPPEGVLTVSAPATPTPAPVPAPAEKGWPGYSSGAPEPPTRWYVLQPGDTFESLAQRFYGNAALGSFLGAVNQGTRGNWTPGNRVWIPYQNPQGRLVYYKEDWFLPAS